MRKECFECGKPATEDHHVIPQSLGGTKTVPLCGTCHDRVHEGGWKRRDNHAYLVSAGIQRAKAKGVKFGMQNPALAERKEEIMEKCKDAIIQQTIEYAESLIDKIIDLRNQELSVNSIAEVLNNEGIKTARGGKWYAKSIANIFDTLNVQFRDKRLGVNLPPYIKKPEDASSDSTQTELTTSHHGAS